MLKSHPASEVSFPDAELMKVYGRMVQIRELMVNNGIGFVDGISLHVAAMTCCNRTQLIMGTAMTLPSPMFSLFLHLGR
jgi:hypothetical protein